jgi:hypothetical protein
MKKFKPLLLAIVCFLISVSSIAWWGQTGHRVVGQIADSHLGKKARNTIREILGTESIAIFNL